LNSNAWNGESKICYASRQNRFAGGLLKYGDFNKIVRIRWFKS